MKKLFCLFSVVVFNLFAVFAQDSLALANDCELLKKYMQEASIDCSMAIDAGLLDMDEVIQKIKDDYDSKKFKARRDKKNSKGIYPTEFAKSIRKVFSEELPYKNLHMSISTKDYFEGMFNGNFVFNSPIFFDKIGNNFFVAESSVRSIKKGMKYTGDEQNLLKTIHNGKELYQFSVFSYYMQRKAKISIENKIEKVPVKWIGNFVQNEEISYKSTDDCFIISITTCSPKDLEKFRKRVSEIRKELETTDKTVIIDLRNNGGGQINHIINILYSLLFEKNDKNAELFNKMQNYCSAQELELNTQTIRDRILVDGRKEKYTRLKLCNEKYVKGYGVTGNVEKVDFAVKNPKYKKNLYILINETTGSAAECFTLWAKKLYEKTILIGKNTAGCVVFGDPDIYSLPDSKVVVRFSETDGRCSISNLCVKNWKGEGVGIFPDYWASSEKIVDTIVHFTKDEKLREIILSGKI